MRRSVLTLALAVTMLLGLLPVASAPAQETPEFRALVFSKTNGFRHASIETGNAAIQQLGAENNFTVDVTEDSAVFTDENLAQYEVVVFNNTNSRNGAILDDEQRAAFERYVQAGGGFTGIHSASGTEYDWAWYGDLLGAFFEVHPPIQEVAIEVDDGVHPSTQHLPQRWVRSEEPYDFVKNVRGEVHVLASFDEQSYNGATMGADHPIAWCQQFDGGRSWYTGLGHASSAYTDEPLFLQHILGGIQWAAGVVEGDCGATDSDNFEKVQLDGNTDDPLDLAVDDTGRVFFVQRGGAVKLYDPAVQRTDVIATLDVFVQHTHGMHGIVLDPGFAENGWMYIYYSPTGDENTLVSRFTFDEATSTLDLASERVLFEIPSQREVNAHEGGGMAFDSSGDMYVAVGDNSLPCCSGFGATDERPGQEYSDAQRTSGNTNDLRGKILRVTPTDTEEGGYTIPEGNLFETGTAQALPEIYGMGMRNPYRIHIDTETDWLYWGDVGPDAREDSAMRGSRGYDEWNQARGPGNFGWPHCIGDNAAYNDYDFATQESGPLYDCAGGPTNDSPNNTGLTQLPPAQPSWIDYPYSVSDTFPELGTGGRLAIGGPTYHFDPELDSEAKFPEYYDETVFIAEWTRNALFEVQLDDEGQPDIINRILPDEEFLRPIDMEFGPDGSLYLVEWGSNYGGSGRGDPNTDSGIYKINYVRPGERAPVARASADPTSGQAPLEVAFSSAGSGDPDEGDTVTYAWDFTSDGTVDSTEPNPTHVYDTPADVTARLTVTDSTGRTAVANVPITVGNTAPEVELVEPLDGQGFTLGDAVDFEVAVDDAEDGSAADGEIDCAEVVTQPALGHDQHAHPLELYSGCEGTIQTIVDDGHDQNDNIFYVVESTYTDRGGNGVARLEGGDSAILQPRRKQAEHWTTAGGVSLYDTRESEGGLMVGNIGHGDFLSFEPVNLRGVTEMVFRVAGAGTGGTIEMRTDAVDGPLIGRAEVEPTGGGYTFTTVTTPVTDPGRTHELFLVFTNNPGDDYLFNLDWLQFANPLTDPLRAARSSVETLRAELDEHQQDNLTGVADEIDRNIAAALDADTTGEAFASSVRGALYHAGRGQTSVTRQRDSGQMAPDVADQILAPLDDITRELSSVDARLRSVAGALEPASEEVVAGEMTEVAVTLTNDGSEPVRATAVSLATPEGWEARPVGRTTSARLLPGDTLTGTWEVVPPIDAEPGEQVLSGSADYRLRGRTRTVLPLTAAIDVVPALEVTGMSVSNPLLSGGERTAAVDVVNRSSTRTSEVQVGLEVPDGWTAGTRTVTLAPGAASTVDVPLTAPGGPPPAGPLGSSTVSAGATAGGEPVAGAPTAVITVAPDGAQAVLALDAGSASSPVMESYQRLAPTDMWDPDAGAGWTSTNQSFRDRGGPDALRRDFALSTEPSVLRIALPPGPHTVSVLRGDNSFSSGSTVVEADGAVVVPAGGNLSRGQYAWEQFGLDGGPEGRTVDLRISNDAGSFWRLVALTLHADSAQGGG